MKNFEGYKLRSIVSIVAKFLEAVFEILIPLVMARLIDVGIGGQNRSVIYSSFILMVILTLFGYVFALICQYNASVVSQAVGGRLRTSLYEHQMSMTKEQVAKFSSSSLVNRVMLDTVFAQDMVARVIRLGVRAPFLIVGTVAALMYINYDLAKILIIAIPVIFTAIALFMYLSMRAHSKVNTNLDNLSNEVSNNLAGSRIIRAFSKQNDVDKDFNQLNAKLYNSQKHVGVVTTLSNPFTTLLMNILLIVLVYVSGININIGTMSQGQTLAVINYCSQLLITLIVSMNLIMVIARGLTSWQRINEVLNTKLVTHSNLNYPDKIINELHVRNLSYSFQDEKRKVLNNINFSIKTGEVVGVIGLTGSGKSTLLNIMAQLINSSEGIITINGVDIQSYNKQSIRNVIGYVPQNTQFIKGTIQDNISMKRSLDYENALLDAQGIDILEKGLHSNIEESGKNLSGGQRQRVNIARALALNAQLLLFDDSFSALDNLTSKKLKQTLKSKYASTMQIIASQRTAAISHADKIIVLDKGIIVGEGTHDQLLKSNEIYRDIYNLENAGGDYNE